ncbi:hypothetical protein HS088_TW20G00001 [Tripterygium wilfordii]|uniref:(S)-ureidoglycine aminohydrolase cupin domain-containing protein n=1 Tax=Tripterygium wilfordii TaxID=458696 RepID=A0A7J7C687_TRIWF|nr:uncharacterized protein LOC119987446 [Tripterygium wilfordii]KAF5729638.1 hypothetical protein HS088_TW20G00001 [Tripterygium wilfordii]
MASIGCAASLSPQFALVSKKSKACISARTRSRPMAPIRAETTGSVMEKAGIKIERNPPESKLTHLGVRSWRKWGCSPSKFPWTYSSKEICYLLEGKVKIYPDGSEEIVEIGAGDLIEFPRGMSCTWDVSVTVDKHYKFY